jgi:hypothetical protein
LRMVDGHDSVRLTGLLLQLRTYLDDHPDDLACVYRMSGGRPRKRSLNDQDELINLFQGRNPLTGPVVYPGDDRIRMDNRLSVQIHTLEVPGLVYRVPAVAIWLPKAMSVAWLSALPMEVQT